MQTISMGPNPMLDANADAEAATASRCGHTLSREVEKMGWHDKVNTVESLSKVCKCELSG